MPRGGHNRRNYGTVEGTRSLDVMELARAGYVGGARQGGLRWQYGDGSRSSIGIAGGTDAITLSYLCQGWESDKWQDVKQRVPIVWTPCRFGGTRPWFFCTCSSGGRYCGRRVAKLYGAGRLFACRHCYQLVHAVQWGGPMDRGHFRLAKLHRKLGAAYECLGDPWPDSYGVHISANRYLFGLNCDSVAADVGGGC